MAERTGDIEMMKMTMKKKMMMNDER